MTKIDIRHIAKLANLPITNEQASRLEGELESTLKHVEELNKIDVSKVEGTNEVVKEQNITREDKIKPSLSQDEALRNAKKTYNGLFVVPVIIEEAVE